MPKFICKFCGRGVDSPNLVANDCAKNPNGKIHEWIDGAKSKYTCKYCGRELSNLVGWVQINPDCSKSPNKYHELM